MSKNARNVPNSETHFRQALDSMLEGCQIVGFDWRYLYLNDAADKHNRRPKEELLGKLYMEIWPGIEGTEVFRVIKRCMETRAPQAIENELVYPDGTKGWFDIRISPVPEGVVIVSADISERKHAEEALKASEALFRSLVEQAADAMYVHDFDGRFMEVNRRACESLGYTREELLTMRVTDVEVDFDLPALQARWAKITPDSAFTLLGHQRRRDGTTFPIEVHFGLFNAGARPYFLGLVRDISERKRMEEAIEKERSLLRTLIDILPDVIAFKNPTGRIITSNHAHQRIAGARGLSEVVGKTDFDFFPSQLAELSSSLEKHVMQSGDAVINQEETVVRDGTKSWLLTSVVPLRDSSGIITGTVSVSRDVTDHKNLEFQLLQAQKMEAIGQLAGGIAHDFNNILTAIIGYATFLQLKLTDGSLQDNASQIITTAERAAQLTQGLLAFSRRQSVNPRPVDVNAIIRGLEKILQRVIGDDVRLGSDLDSHELVILADTGQIEQILMNLATNSRDAMPDGGTIRISTSRVTFDDLLIATHGFGIPGSYAMISFEDTGHGINKEISEKIFEPFFTTKEVGKGTGLGLSIVYGIVRQHNGYINVYSEPAKGTTFRIYLPIVRADTADIGPAREESRTRGTETILLAEDDAAVRKLARLVLEESGYTVIEAADGEEALARFYEDKERVRLLILDVMMPKKSGKVVAEEIRRECAWVRILFTSGYTANTIRDKGILEESPDFITKPFSPGSLLAKIREILDR